jgi:hypothetical protein
MRPTTFGLSVFAAIAIAIACGMVLWISQRRDEHAISSLAASSGEQRVAPIPATVDTEHVTQYTTNDGASPARTAVAAHCRVVSKDGQAISGAEATWTPLLPAWLQASHAWPDMDWVELARRSRTVTTDADGNLSFVELPSDPDALGSVLWITHPGFRAKSIVLDYPSTAVALPPTIELGPGGQLTGRVIDAAGQPVANASVVQLVYLGRENPELGSEKDLDAKYVLRRISLSASDGRIVLPTFPVLNWVYAEQGGLMSRAWAGIPPADFILDLCPTFTASGHVSLDPVASVDHRTCIRAALRNGAEFRTLDRCKVRNDGGWGPVRLPVQACEAVVFMFEGGAFSQQHVSISPPKAGDNVTVDFHPHLGVGFPVCIVDAKNQPIPKANAYVQWMIDNYWVEIERYTDANGNATFEGCTPGKLYLNVSAPGYIFRRLEPFELRATQTECTTVVLQQAAVVRGRCSHRGKTVNEFTVRWWHNRVEDGDEVQVRNDPNGEFTIPEVSPGDVFLFASSKDYPQSEIKHVVASLDRATEVDIDLPDPLEGQGKVVDAITGDPIRDARVQLFRHHEGRKVDKYNAPAETDARGQFMIRGLIVGSNPIEVSAADHAKRTIVLAGTAGERVDCGLITLFSTQKLDLRLAGGSVDDYSKYGGELLRWRSGPKRQFSADGVLHWESVDPGFYSFVLHFPDGLSHQEFPIKIQPGRDYIRTFDVSNRSMPVELIAESGHTIPKNAELCVSARSSSGSLINHYYRVTSDRTVSVGRVEGENIITLYVDGVPLTSEQFTIGSDDPDKLQMHIKLELREFKVVDRAGVTVPDVTLTLTLPEDTTPWFVRRTTDANGMCRFQGLSFQDVVINMSKSAGGMQAGKICHLGAPSEEVTTLVFDPQYSLELLALERSIPMPGIEFWATDAQSTTTLQSASSNEKGVASWGAVSNGRFFVSVIHPGYWPSQQVIESVERGHPVPFQIRRLGGIECTARNSHENPESGLSIDFYSEEFKTWASSWIASGDLISPVGGLKTSSDGKLRINALPNGPFKWLATSSSGTSVEGTVVVPSSGTAQLVVSVP